MPRTCQERVGHSKKPQRVSVRWYHTFGKDDHSIPLLTYQALQERKVKQGQITNIFEDCNYKDIDNVLTSVSSLSYPMQERGTWDTCAKLKNISSGRQCGHGEKDVRRRFTLREHVDRLGKGRAVPLPLQVALDHQRPFRRLSVHNNAPASYLGMSWLPEKYHSDLWLLEKEDVHLVFSQSAGQVPTPPGSPPRTTTSSAFLANLKSK